MHVTRILTKEHVLIKQVLDLLDESRQALETDTWVPVIFFEKAGIFCSEFADRFHHYRAVCGTGPSVRGFRHVS